MSTPFSTKEVAFINKSGPATISGQGFFRQRGGGVVTCAGEEVNLIPAGQYAKEFITKSFRNVNGGVIPVIMAPQVQHSPEFSKFQRKTQCDAQGNFEFKNVANGEYYVATKVLWQVGNQILPEGGALAELVRVQGGQSQKVVLN